MTTDNKQVLTDYDIVAAMTPQAGLLDFARAIEQAVLSKLRGADEPSDSQIAALWANTLTQGKVATVIPFARALLAKYTAPQASAEVRNAALVHAAREVLDTELGAAACTGSDAPAEHALGQLKDALAEDSAKGAGDVEFPLMPEPAARTSAFSKSNQVLPYYTYGQMMAYAHTAVLADRQQRGGDAGHKKRLETALLDCNTVAVIRGDMYLSDCIDNTGTCYQSQALADLIAIAQQGKEGA